MFKRSFQKWQYFHLFQDFPCLYQASPPGTALWRKLDNGDLFALGNKGLNSSSPISKINDKTEEPRNLAFAEVKLAHSGQYECAVSNLVGKNSATTELVVIRK